MRIVCFLLILGVCSTAHAGYGHSWTWHGKPDPARLALAEREMRQIIAAYPGVVALDPAAAGLAFNGLGNDALEPFMFPDWGSPDDPSPRFCKTMALPYDDIVTACLLVARDHFSRDELEIASDGGSEDWELGRQVYSTVLHRDPPNMPELAQASAILGPAGEGPSLFTVLTVGGGVVLLFFLLGILGVGGGTGAGWSSYYLAYLVGPMVLSGILGHPWILLVILPALLARRWLPDPLLWARHARRRRQLAQQVDDNPQNVTARRDLAMMWLERRRPARAQPLLEAALALEPRDTELRFLLGLCQLQRKQYEPAVAAMSAVLHQEERFRYGDAYLHAGEALLGLGRWDDAAEGLRRFLAINGSSVEGRVKLARALRGQGQLAAARQMLAEARRTHRGLPPPQRRRQLHWYVRALAPAALA